MRMEGINSLASQHDGEVDSSANADPQPPRVRLPLLQVDVPSPPQAKRLVPRRISPPPGTSYPLVIPSVQPLVGHIQNASNTLLEPCVPVVPTVLVIYTSAPQRETPRSLPAHPHPRPHFVSSPPARAPAPALAASAR